MIAAIKLKDTPCKENYDQPRKHIKKKADANKLVNLKKK